MFKMVSVCLGVSKSCSSTRAVHQVYPSKSNNCKYAQAPLREGSEIEFIFSTE